MSQPVDDRHGFVRADCAACGDPDVWLTCNQCGKSDRFETNDGRIVCACGAAYDHAVCTCKQTVPGERLRWVEWRKGPPALADWEVDWARVGILLTGVVGVIGLLGLLIWSRIG